MISNGFIPREIVKNSRVRKGVLTPWIRSEIDLCLELKIGKICPFFMAAKILLIDRTRWLNSLLIAMAMTP